MLSQKFIIDTEFEALLPKLDTETLNLLESQIVADGGCRDALVVWQEEGILVDGHNRFRICEKHGIPLPEIVKIGFESREAVKYWMLVTQDSRRQYTNEQKDYYRGMR